MLVVMTLQPFPSYLVHLRYVLGLFVLRCFHVGGRQRGCGRYHAYHTSFCEHVRIRISRYVNIQRLAARTCARRMLCGLTQTVEGRP
jgi:hypothetical protein